MLASKCCALGGPGASRAESLPQRESWRWGSHRRESQLALSNPNRLGWPQESRSTCPTAGSRPRTAPGRSLHWIQGQSPHKDALCLCAWRQAASRAQPTRAGQRDCPEAKSPSPTCPTHLQLKDPPSAPRLKHGCPVGCTRRAPPTERNRSSRRTRKGRTSRSAEVCFVAGRRGRAPRCPTPGPPHHTGCGTRGSSTARSPLVQSTTCLGLHLVTGSMVRGSAARWAGKSAAELCSLRPRLSPARPGRPLKPAWPRSAGHLAAARPGERGRGSRSPGQLCAVRLLPSHRRPAAVLPLGSPTQLPLRAPRSWGRTAADSEPGPGLPSGEILPAGNF